MSQFQRQKICRSFMAPYPAHKLPGSLALVHCTVWLCHISSCALHFTTAAVIHRMTSWGRSVTYFHWPHYIVRQPVDRIRYVHWAGEKEYSEMYTGSAGSPSATSSQNDVDQFSASIFRTFLRASLCFPLCRRWCPKYPLPPASPDFISISYRTLILTVASISCVCRFLLNIHDIPWHQQLRNPKGPYIIPGTHITFTGITNLSMTISF